MAKSLCIQDAMREDKREIMAISELYFCPYSNYQRRKGGGVCPLAQIYLFIYLEKGI